VGRCSDQLVVDFRRACRNEISAFDFF